MTGDRLSDLQQDAWGGFLRTHTEIYRELDRRMNAGQRLSMSDYDVLLRLARATDGLPMGALASAVLMTTGGLTRLVDRLQSAGLIERTRSPGDGRSFRAHLTTAGRRAFRRANRQHLADVRELILDHLTDDQLHALADAWQTVDAARRDQPTRRRESAA